jgi:hypothetical protein
MLDKDRLNNELIQIKKDLEIVEEAGFGEVIIKVQDHVVVNIEHKAQKGMKIK